VSVGGVRGHHEGRQARVCDGGSRERLREGEGGGASAKAGWRSRACADALRLACTATTREVQVSQYASKEKRGQGRVRLGLGDDSEGCSRERLWQGAERCSRACPSLSGGMHFGCM
jgi:hypothetical protein